MKTRTIKEHYIPNKSYLDYFVDRTLNPNSLWVYFDKNGVRKDASLEVPKNISPVNLCKESYLYETPRLPINSIEKMLQSIENNYKHVLDTKIIPKKSLTVDDRMAVAYFISTLEQRTPLNKVSSDKFISDIREQAIHLQEQYAPGSKSKFLTDLDKAEKQNLMFTQMLLTATQMNRYQVTDMLFLSPGFDDEELFFVTSDFPVSMVDFRSLNSFYPPTPLDTTVEVTIPLTPNITLLVNHLGLNGYKEIDHNYVWEINSRTISRSNRFIISPRKLSDRFTDLNIRRYPQSFVVEYMADYISKCRLRRSETSMKNTFKSIVKSIAKRNKNNNVDFLMIQAKDNDEFTWYERVVKLLGEVEIDAGLNQTVSLFKPITTTQGKVWKIKVIIPNI